MRRRCLLLVCLSLVVGFAPAPFARTRRDPATDDLRRMQGRWVVVSYENEGVEYSGVFGGVFGYEFAGERMNFTLDDAATSSWSVELSPASVPRALTKTTRDGRTTYRCIYRFEGDTLVICENRHGGTPTSFHSRGYHWLLVARRR